MNLDELIIEMETKFAYQDKTIEDLNQVVIAQQNQIEKLSNKVSEIKAQLLASEKSPIKNIREETPPPHY